MGKDKELRRWKESRWVSPKIDCKQAKIVTLGVDVGSVSSQAVIMCDGELFAYANMRTGADSLNSALNAVNWALEGTGLTMGDIHSKVATGYGRINIPFVDRSVTEISCHAFGGIYMYGPTVRTILDMGGQDCKVIHCDEKGKVTAFLMNDKCAAGTGRGLEVIAELLEIPLNELGERSLQVEKEPDPVSSTCVVFAKSEAIGLLRSGWSKEKVLAAYCAATAIRVVSLIKRIGMKEDFAITGGIAKNIGIVSRIEKLLGVKALESRFDTQIAGAMGAALFARSLIEKSGN